MLNFYEQQNVITAIRRLEKCDHLFAASMMWVCIGKIAADPVQFMKDFYLLRQVSINQLTAHRRRYAK